MVQEERAALALATRDRGVHGLDVLHLQCHLGCDAVTLAREGARVTGVDFSRTALERLDELARPSATPRFERLKRTRATCPPDSTPLLIWSTPPLAFFAGLIISMPGWAVCAECCEMVARWY